MFKCFSVLLDFECVNSIFNNFSNPYYAEKEGILK